MTGCYHLYLLLFSVVAFSVLLLLRLLQSILRSRGALLEGQFRWSYILAAVLFVLYIVVVVSSAIKVMGNIELVC